MRWVIVGKYYGIPQSPMDSQKECWIHQGLRLNLNSRLKFLLRRDSIEQLTGIEKIYSESEIRPETGREYPLKRPFDILLSSVGIVLSFPLWIIIAIAIWLE